ncbi:META domain-containing protein [Terrabacter sp. C0L_2]|uniref:META domain-containing protein n=1 Tax=Terrabacter sp. C0L_2 TaxID=3108389 RepID=UPI002ED63B9E|nr:META domain-containing protein [Terrabacter sp. C0L_2]
MADNEVAGTSWVVEELGGAATVPPKPQLSFGDDGRVSGSTGVNRLMGRYEVTDGLLRVADAATTRVAGPPDAMEQEQRLLALLDAPQAFVVSGDRLEVGDGETLAVLVRADTPTDTPTDAAPSD